MGKNFPINFRQNKRKRFVSKFWGNFVAASGSGAIGEQEPAKRVTAFVAPSRILLVDDDPVMLELAHAKLGAAGYAIELASNGAEALDILRARACDLVISDLEMPVMDGFELTKTIRKEPALAETPVIVITASDSASAVDRAFGAGATSFLAKPINWTLFSQAVMFVLRASADQKSLREARDLAEAGARFKDTLMSVMSHELRTPLNAIIGFGQLLGEQFEARNDHLHKEYADYIVEGGRRLLNSVSDMLLAGDARAGALKLNEADATVAELIEAARAPVQKLIEETGAELTIRLQNSDLELCCDRGLMARALAKLLENAVKFSPKGARVTVGAASTAKGELAFLIKDDGPGISEEMLADVTVPFGQRDMSLARSKEGLGLGIPMARAIADAHGARFRLDSKLGEGTQALIVLPAERIHGPARASVAA